MGHHVRVFSSSSKWNENKASDQAMAFRDAVLAFAALSAGVSLVTQDDIGSGVTRSEEAVVAPPRPRPSVRGSSTQDMNFKNESPSSSLSQDIVATASLLSSRIHEPMHSSSILDDWNSMLLSLGSGVNVNNGCNNEATTLKFVQPSPTATSASAAVMSGASGVIDAMEASVEKAHSWEKKAVAAVVEKWATPKRYETSVRAIMGHRLAMEDTFCIHDGGRFTGVFDGHGGAQVSKFLSESIYEKVKKNLAQDGIRAVASPSIGNIVTSIGAAFDETELEVLKKDELQWQGSTAVAVYVHEDEKTKERTIISANVGDSRAVLSRGSVAVDLTRDHKPDDKYEKERIISMGETIEWDSYCQVSRVKSLSLSRAIGDRFAKPVVSGEVEIQLFPLKDLLLDSESEESVKGNDDFIVLGSDGLWDVMTSQSCVDFVNEYLHPSETQAKSMSPAEKERYKISRRKNMSRYVASEATRRGSSDNICVVVVWLNEVKRNSIE